LILMLLIRVHCREVVGGVVYLLWWNGILMVGLNLKKSSGWWRPLLIVFDWPIFIEKIEWSVSVIVFE
jgi:hypothetical protein